MKPTREYVDWYRANTNPEMIVSDPFYLDDPRMQQPYFQQQRPPQYSQQQQPPPYYQQQPPPPYYQQQPPQYMSTPQPNQHYIPQTQPQYHEDYQHQPQHSHHHQQSQHLPQTQSPHQHQSQHFHHDDVTGSSSPPLSRSIVKKEKGREEEKGAEEQRIEMAGRGRDDAAIAEALGMLAGVLGGNPNVVGMGAARQLSEFQKNNPPMFKGAYDPDGAQKWLKEIERIF
ncbi:hypothetical protein KIW84_053619 [Lathyrus oleraceus]|uniref:Uncharacterized protein n=1 Tax=Pisum sativum TaxID=3888 RepID=A0A9D4WRX8_PEA|nr:hypothetical protein KIW84_053619 [Pisum sativum]